MTVRYSWGWWLRLTLVGAAAGVAVIAAVPKPHLLDRTGFSSCYRDREGNLLRLTLAPDDRYRLCVPLEKISPQLVEMTLLHEDRYFENHPGFNPVAFARAAASLGGHGPRLGASTVTMQLVRLHYRLNTRTPWGKFCQIVGALHLEWHCSKREILEAYLNLAPYGRNIEGIGAASLIYFGKTPDRLTPVEALTLAVLPQSPARRAPGTPRHEEALRRAREVLLAQWLRGHPDDARLREVLAMPIQVSLPRDLPFRAPHLVEELKQDRPGERAADTRLALDPGLQALLEREVGGYVEAHGEAGVRNACALLVDAATMEVVAAVGSADYGRADRQGQVDGLRMSRSPGSALKPFVYALTMDEGLIHPHSLLVDAPRSFGGYAPENFDREYAGPIFACDALVQSRNVPAVELEARLPAGSNLYALLAAAGVRGLRDEAHYGLSLALGSAEVSPEELAALYVMLANGGMLRPLAFEAEARPGAGTRLLSPEACWLTLDMLRRTPPPEGLAEARPVAWKTGTSFSYRDAWCAGVFDRYALVVWAGDFAGAVSSQVVGRTAAAPLFFSVVDAVRASRPAPAVTSLGLEPAPGLNLRQIDLCAVSGCPAGPDCPRVEKGWFIPGKSPIAACDVHRRVWIDNRTGLRLPARSANPAAAHAQVYEFWPSNLARLLREAGFPKAVPPPLLAAASGPVAAPERGPRIASPGADRVYLVRLGRGNEPLDLEASAEGSRDRLRWFVDAAYLGASPAGAALSWSPRTGRHTIRVVDDLGRSDSRVITVAPAE